MIPGMTGPVAGMAGTPVITLTQKGYGYIAGASDTADLSLSYANVSGGSAPSAGDLVVWHVLARMTGGNPTPMNDLSGDGWEQSSFGGEFGVYISALAKVVESGDISSPPEVLTDPNSGSVAFWVAYSVEGEISTLTIGGEDADTGSTGGGGPSTSLGIDLTSVSGARVASSLLTGTDDSVDSGWTGATPDGSDARTDAFGTGVDATRYWKLYPAEVAGDNITAVGADHGSSNSNSVFYVQAIR